MIKFARDSESILSIVMMAIHKGQESCLPHNLPNDLILAARVRMKNQEAYTQMFGPGLFDSPQALGSSIDGTSHIAIQANQDGSGPQIQGDHVISKQQYMRHNTSDLRALKPTNNDSAVPYSSPNQTWVGYESPFYNDNVYPKQPHMHASLSTMQRQTLENHSSGSLSTRRDNQFAWAS